MRKSTVIFWSGLVALAVCATPVSAQKRSVAEEILEILRAENKISDEKYQELMSRAKAESEAREAGVEAYRRDPVKSVQTAIDWLNRFSFSGDMRTRYEAFWQEHGPNANQRGRARIRLRFGVGVKVNDEVSGGLRLVSGDPNDPISANQTLTDVFTKKPINIDQAFITLTPKASLKAIGLGLADLPWNPISITMGKFANPAFRPRAIMNSELIFDDDLNPEGLSETITFYEGTEGLLRRFQLNAMQWTVREASRSADSYMFGGQFVGTFQLLPSTRLTLAFADYAFTKSDLIAQARNSNSSLKVTNSVVLVDGTVVKGGTSLTPGTGGKAFKKFLGDFNLINGSVQLDYNTGYARWPLTLMGDVAWNSESPTSKDWAVWAGISLGATRNPGDWAFSAVWSKIETDSVLSVFSYSDFGRDGGTNLQGPFLKIDYMLFPRLTITAKNHFVSFIDRPKGQSNSLVNRFQLDAQLVF
jgi:putative porin